MNGEDAALRLALPARLLALVFANTSCVNMRLLEMGAPSAYPVDSAILVLLRETARCKMEQKKDTILSGE